MQHNKRIFVLGAQDQPREYLRLQCMLLERGVPFPGLESGRLPMDLPPDLDEFCALVYCARDAHRLAAPAIRGRIERFKQAGGRIYPVQYEWNPGSGFIDVHPYFQPTYLENLVEDIISIHALPDETAAISAACASRSIESVAGEMARCLLGPITHYFTSWTDSAVNYLRSLRSLHQILADPELKQRAIEVADILCATVPAIPTNGDHIQPMAMLVEIHEDGWIAPPPYEAMLAAIESYLSRCHWYGKVIAADIPSSCAPCGEGVAMFTPTLCAMGRVCNRPDLVRAGVEHLLESERVLRDPADGLWPHGLTGSRQQPVKWSRGMGWAMFGASRALRHLADDPSHRQAVLDVLRRQVRSLAGVQTEFGWWTNILDMPMSRAESSGTGMHLESLMIAIRHGINTADIISAAHAAVRGVKALTWNGQSYLNCAGADIVNTGPLYYLRRPVEMGPPIYLALGLGGTVNSLGNPFDSATA